MLPGTAYTVRTENDTLVAYDRGRAVATLSLADGRTTSDGSQPPVVLTILRLRAQAIRAAERTPSLRERMLAGVRGAEVRPLGQRAVADQLAA